MNAYDVKSFGEWPDDALPHLRPAESVHENKRQSIAFFIDSRSETAYDDVTRAHFFVHSSNNF